LKKSDPFEQPSHAVSLSLKQSEQLVWQLTSSAAPAKEYWVVFPDCVFWQIPKVFSKVALHSSHLESKVQPAEQLIGLQVVAGSTHASWSSTYSVFPPQVLHVEPSTIW
jgi:hypothetical protein